jgi:hypothetical protein
MAVKISLLVFRVVTNTFSEKHAVSILSPEDGDSMFLRNVCVGLPVLMALQPRRPTSQCRCLFA